MYTLPSTCPQSQQAFEQLLNFFDAWGFAGALHFTGMQESTALHRKAWRHKEPYSIIRFNQQLQQLVSAVFVLAADPALAGAFTVAPGKDGQPDITLTQHYVGQYKPATAWQYFPRHLGPKQYCEPMRVLQKFTRYRSLLDWRELLDELLEYSLSQRSIYGHRPGVDYSKVRKLLLKVVEAGHLMVVRKAGMSGE